ncbi:SDR family oxidoreductase [Cytobacillus horneckiae]|uniref:NAD(P)-dependent oxidoreductase n=1 Tax=Cytobacillus horneckiae TaxID=549687 RepID=A0A2N0ZB57_9BACI|nr:SDR family oxidoreductase [Cytobacillus horneckiae]MEC1155502.1 SDR family oxidoreductase [Cytobacillus horneckiae]MED2936821.1 SDR family oxidoreductase [Cytobacillus horneckiae]PKG26757.1 NAD(P)-dependent oxidoreductase [Cytobacillus horneckiae]
MTNNNEIPKNFAAQHQNQQPGLEDDMIPEPIYISDSYKAAGKLNNKVAIITGGDSGIGKSTAIYFAKEGADVVVVYLNEHQDAEDTKKYVEAEGKQCLLLPGDIGQESFCVDVVKQTIEQFGKIDILVNNAGEQHPQQNLQEISTEQLEKTFKTNIFSMFHLTKAVLPHLQSGAAIVNTASVTAYAGNKTLIDYSSTKGAIVSYTRSLSLTLADQGIRVNAVAPGPIWTPLIPSTFPADQVAQFRKNVPFKRAGQPFELAPAYVYLASDDSSYVSGQVIHVNGGKVVNG